MIFAGTISGNWLFAATIISANSAVAEPTDFPVTVENGGSLILQTTGTYGKNQTIYLNGSGFGAYPGAVYASARAYTWANYVLQSDSTIYSTNKPFFYGNISGNHTLTTISSSEIEICNTASLDLKGVVVGTGTGSLTFHSTAASGVTRVVQDGITVNGRMLLYDNASFRLSRRNVSNELVMGDIHLAGGTLQANSSACELYAHLNLTQNATILTDSNITLNGTLRGGTSKLTKRGAATLTIHPQDIASDYTGGIEVAAGTLNLSLHTTSEVKLKNMLTGTGDVLKTGTGTLTWEANEPNNTGKWTIAEGIANVNSSVGTFGDSLSRMEIQSGATLQISKASDTVNVIGDSNTPLHIAGTGKDHLGAIYTNNQRVNINSPIVLDADAMIRCDGTGAGRIRIHTSISDGENDATLTIRSNALTSEPSIMHTCTLDLNRINVDAGVLTFNGYQYGVSRIVEDGIHVASGATLRVFGMPLFAITDSTAQPGDVYLKGGTLEISGNANTSFTADLNLVEDSTVNTANTLSNMTLSGTLTGDGKWTKTGNGTLTVARSDFTGDLAIHGGKVVLSPAADDTIHLSGEISGTGTLELDGEGVFAMATKDHPFSGRLILKEGQLDVADLQEMHVTGDIFVGDLTFLFSPETMEGKSGIYNLLSADGGIFGRDGEALDVTRLLHNLDENWRFYAQDGALAIASADAVPEPASWILLLGSLVGWALYRKGKTDVCR